MYHRCNYITAPPVRGTSIVESFRCGDLCRKWQSDLVDPRPSWGVGFFFARQKKAKIVVCEGPIYVDS